MTSDDARARVERLRDKLNDEDSALFDPERAEALSLLLAELDRLPRLREAATRLVGAHSREVIARAKWVNEPEPWSHESRQMFEAVLAREAETSDAALAVGAIVFPDETRLTAALETL